MVCPQDEELMSLGIAVDDFREKNAHIFFLTHAHSDHMPGLLSAIKSRPDILVYCTHVTMQLVLIQYPQLPKSVFREVLYQVETRVSGVTVTALPSHHCPGSAMFHFKISAGHPGDSSNLKIGKANPGDSSNLKISTGSTVLYTGDFRYDDRYRDFAVFRRAIDRMYYDDTFDEIGREQFPAYPSPSKSISDLFYRICAMRDGRDITINASILGIESALIELAIKKDFRFRISDALSSTYRGRQIEYLMREYLDDSSDLVIGHRKIDPMERGVWIIPTCTRFLCAHPRPAMEGHHYVWFSTHPCKEENARMRRLAAPKSVNPCQFKVETLKCNTQS